MCEVIGGGTPSKDKAHSAFYSGDIPWATVRDMKSDLISDTEFKISKEAVKASSTNIIPKGNVVVATRVGLGKVCLIEHDTAINQDLRGVVPKDAGKLAVRFLFWWLKSVAQLIVKEGTGATVQGVKLPFIKSLPIPTPPLPEQQRIVAILDEAFEGIAIAAANAEKNLNNAREVFDNTVQSVFANRAEGWEEKTLNQVAENLDSKRVPITKNARSSGSYPYYGASGIVDYVDEFIFDDDLLLVSEDGANLLARTYPIAFSINGKTWVNNHAHVLRFKEMATQKLVQFYLNSIPLDDYVSGMTQPKLNQKMLNTIVVPYPPLAEQQRIVAKLDELSTETKKLEAIYQQKLLALDELKKSILHQAFSGQLY